jgi:hypothetical protein
VTAFGSLQHELRVSLDTPHGAVSYTLLAHLFPCYNSAIFARICTPSSKDLIPRTYNVMLNDEYITISLLITSHSSDRIT